MAARRPAAASGGREIRWRGGTYELVAIDVEGNAHAPEADLLANLSLAHDRDLDDDVLRHDELVVAAYYYDRGYLMVHVEPILLVRKEFGDEVRARVVVREGPVFTVTRLDAYEQPTSGGRAPLSVPWTRPPMVGRPFARSVLVDAVSALRTRYHDRGQAFVDVNVLDALDVPSRTVALDLAVTPGAYYFLGAIVVTGQRALTPEWILGELALREGDLYSDSALLLALAHLRSLPWFSSVVVSTHRGAREGTLDVHFEVEERPGLSPRIAAR